MQITKELAEKIVEDYKVFLSFETDSIFEYRIMLDNACALMGFCMYARRIYDVMISDPKVDSACVNNSMYIHPVPDWAETIQDIRKALKYRIDWLTKNYLQDENGNLLP